ncbi:MAG: penicillin-binding protein 1C [Candidatus Hydrogenedentes bacterium]|nr:penicillin-binding protein 1C [Candidatus Hydrogenedentota bacterium]
MLSALRRRLRRHGGQVVALTVAAVGLAGAVVLLWPMDPSRYLETESSGEMLDGRGRLMHAFLNADEQWAFARDLKAISPCLVQATLAAEDERFYRHPGVDPVAVARAAWQNVRGGRIVSGASTLTMQVVKGAEPGTRSLWGKARQAVQAVRLDARVPKNAILCAYLNRAPYGMNLVGCEAAARRYFGKQASELTPAEAALLAGLPKAPARLMPLEHPDAARARRNYVLERMRDEGYLSEAGCAQACREPLGVRRHAFPGLARHLAATLEAPARGGNRIATTLDRDIQERAEGLVARAVAASRGTITNAALIAVDLPACNVLARVGSADFFDTPGGGQVDACRAMRSPGSALKPFTYALAIEHNCLYACEMLQDGSLDYGLYNPENYDGRYRGLVSAAYALKRSLNVPAVTVLDRVGVDEAHGFLQDLGLTTLRRESAYYGLGLTLGNPEVRLDELAAAYCALANLGEYRPLHMLADAPAAPGVRRLSRGACLELYAMLEHPLPAELGDGLIHAVGAAPPICWKTGTSTGHRDAWAFVFNRHYLVGVWMGNNDARPSPALVGAQAALPLAGRMFRSLEPKSTPAWPELGEDLRPVTVCAVTGLPASPWCTHTREEMLPRAQYLHRRCAVHGPSQTARGGVVERWPGSTKGWDLAKASPVAFAGGDASKTPARAERLRILTPSSEAEYVLTGEPAGDRLRLSASTEREGPLHWYLDGHYLGESMPDAPLSLALAPGAHRLTCMAATGALDTVGFAVARPAGAVRFGD